MRTSELIGPALNWAVVKASGQNAEYWLEKYASEDRRCMCESPSTDWSQGGPIIEREYINITHPNGFDGANDEWVAAWKFGGYEQYCGSTPLIAAMRCYVASKLGDEIQIPEELK